MRQQGSSRRQFLGQAFSAVSALASPRLFAIEPVTERRDQLLDEMERRACRYFFEMADPATGLVRDRALVAESYAPGVSSIAATGFGLSALVIAGTRGYLDSSSLRLRTRRTLEFLVDGAAQERGFFYHFLDSSTGKRLWASEASSVDTAWLLCGVLHAGAHWQDPLIDKLCRRLLDRTDWRWMLNGKETLSHGWTPEVGFLPYRWDAYSELLAMYLLAMASETKGIPASCWDAWKRPFKDYRGIFYIDAATPLFVHQYSHAWFDFRDRTDRYANYFRNSQRATQAHRLYCIQLSRKFPWYGPDLWGVTSSDSQNGYRAWGFPHQPPDGTLVPCAAGGSLVFLPEMCATVLETMLDRFGTRVWGKYGFVDAFHPERAWYSPDVIGIDLGIMLMMAENLRGQSVWRAVMATPEAKRGMKAAGFRDVTA